MTCKDCVHCNVCGYHIDEETFMTTEECSHFKNKVDFVEVVHGHWVEKEKGYTTNLGGKGKKPYRECSICGWDYPVITVEQHFKQYKYCPHCGADMKKEGADNG